jgi:vacuolar-type H+-ATPase subunit E/Vma4
MNVQELTSGIINEARSQAEQIDQETYAEVMRIRKETEELVAKERERMHTQMKREQELLIARAEAKRQLESRQKVLSYKQELIDGAFKAAQQQLTHSAKRRQLLRRLWQHASKQITVGSVITTKDSARMFKVPKKVVPGLGGFIALSKDGKVRVDMRFETLLSDVKSRKTAEVAKALFAEEKVTKPTKKVVKRKKK